MDKSYLAHHGIKGQRWGVRRYQNPDGTLTDAGEKRYGQNGSKQGKLEQLYYKSYKKTYDINDEDARAMAKKKAHYVAGVAAGTAGVALALYIGTKAYQKGYLSTDRRIKSGELLQTLSHNPERLKNGEAFYTNFMEKDKETYVGWFGRSKGEYKYKIQAPINSDILVASENTGRKAFKELMKNDHQFKENFKEMLSSNAQAKVVYGKGYHFFNAAVLPQYDDGYASEMADTFYNHLKTKGYGGVIDVNDTRYSRLRGHSPTIIFDRDKVDIGKSIVSQITSDEAHEAAKKAGHNVAELRRVQSRADVKAKATLLTGTTILGYGSTAMNRKAKAASRDNARQKYINQYKKQGIDLSGEKTDLDRKMRSRSWRKEHGLTYNDYYRYRNAISYGKFT